MGYGIWDMGYGIWDMGYGIWDMGYGIWDMGYGIWDLGFGIWLPSYLHLKRMLSERQGGECERQDQLSDLPSLLCYNDAMVENSVAAKFFSTQPEFFTDKIKAILICVGLRVVAIAESEDLHPLSSAVWCVE
jgi:hypothetical protein